MKTSCRDKAALPKLRESDMLVANFNQSDDDVRAFMVKPWVMTSSDSSPGHPRAYATFAQKYAEYVLVNGQPTVENGAATGKAAGRALLRKPAAGLCPG